MPAVATERFGRKLDYDRGERIYIVIGTDDAGDARDAVLSAAPASWEGLTRIDRQVDVDEVTEGMANNGYIARVPYRRSEYSSGAPATGDSTYSFDTTGGTQRITQSRSTVQAYDSSGAATNPFKGAIGVKPDGSVEGIDIVAPSFRFSETHYIAAGSVDNTYKGTLFDLTGTMNDNTFKGLAAGECLFLGARGSRRNTDDWEITFDFGGAPNETSLPVGSITVAAKLGWDYLWIYRLPDDEQTAKVLIANQEYAVVERVYRVGDFSDLGIGT